MSRYGAAISKWVKVFKRRLVAVVDWAMQEFRQRVAKYPFTFLATRMYSATAQKAVTKTYHNRRYVVLLQAW
jgi:hypothetical protein